MSSTRRHLVLSSYASTAAELYGPACFPHNKPRGHSSSLRLSSLLFTTDSSPECHSSLLPFDLLGSPDTGPWRLHPISGPGHPPSLAPPSTTTSNLEVSIVSSLILLHIFGSATHFYESQGRRRHHEHQQQRAWAAAASAANISIISTAPSAVPGAARQT